MDDIIRTTAPLQLDPSREQLEDQTIRLFEQRFHSHASHVSSAPGRVNLIGEHTDYNDGYVLPLAIDRYTAVAAGARRDTMLRAYSENLQSSIRAPLDDLVPRKRPSWSNYIRGIALLLQRSGATLPGVTLCIKGTIPRGAGLSSSAALEIAAAHAIRMLSGLACSDLDLIHLCQKAEHEFVGVLCGIMDQYVTTLGKTGTAMLLDCRTLDSEHIRIPPELRILILDTGVRRSLSSSGYNTRREECTMAVKILQKVLPDIRALRDVQPEDFSRYSTDLSPALRKRAQHVVNENQRVLRAAQALGEGDLDELGTLLYESHMSLKHLYEVSCTELDALVDICAECEGVVGARMTGAGFGGSVVCLAHKGAVADVNARVEREYPARTGKSALSHVCAAEDGLHGRSLTHS
jgi:galactokinase